ncbi:MAG: hydroxyphenylacetyl-CoA thioesterase PaaI [Candidatus Accumulibacter sp.]|nr:hydroxyphenylacetyl-CoA thioesterase PaaI [Accumulibacter sp.]
MPDPASPDPDPDPETARLLAEQTAEAMFSRDAASKLIDLKLASVRPGYSRLTMLVRPDMVNGHHICHGGYLFTLADSAFAYACNSYNRNTVASACHIDFLTPAREGELLEAECEERSLAGRTGVYDTTIRNARGKVVALFRGKSYRIAGEVIAGLEAEDSEPGASSSAARQVPDAVEGNPQ